MRTQFPNTSGRRRRDPRTENIRNRRFGPRVPTFALDIKGQSPSSIAERLGAEGIFVRAGHFYAVALAERLGVLDQGAWFASALSTTTLLTKLTACWTRSIESLRAMLDLVLAAPMNPRLSLHGTYGQD